ncbi:MAG: hypothetical protein K0S92_1758, partial [Desertimonas sp.]|nr:hypothetical protein [Desertimonas sp.]
GNHARVDIIDSGGGDGVDEVVIFGTNQGDNIRLNAAGSGAFRIGIVDALSTATTRVTYRQVERVSIYLMGGNDTVLSDDTAVTNVIDLGGGDDRLIVGTVPLVPDTGNRTLEFPDGVPVADTEAMPNGNSGPMFAIGGGQNDTFEVNHNRAKLFLAGSAGDDMFLLKTFIALRENPLDAADITNLAMLFGGTGMNRYEYVQNAPVQINGGPGTDTIVVIGTPIGDSFVVTDTYIAGAGRVVGFTGIERIEVNGAGGPDRIWILSTSSLIETTVDGGTGDDEIHIGGTPPLLVFDPPSFLYTPPAITVQLPPVVTYTAQSVTLSGFTFTLDVLQWIAAGGNPLNPSASTTLANTLATNIANRIGTLRALFDPLTQFDSASANVTDVRLRFSFLPFLFNTDVRITADLTLNYQVGTITSQTKLVQPPTIVVDPPAFGFQSPGVSNLSGIAGRLTIRGGDAPEGLGDRVIVHNEALVGATTGKLETFTQPRYVQVGQDGAGNPLYAQDQDADSGDDLYESSLELRGIGLGITDANHVGLNGLTVFHGIELQGIESLDIRFGTGADTFTVVDTGFMRADNGQQTTTLLPTKLTISGGAGGDTINLQQIGGETRISGGGGADIVNVHSPANDLARILGLVTFDGDGTLTQTPIAFIDTDARLQIFLTTRNTIVGDGDVLTTADGRSYRLALFEPILLDPNTSVSGSALQVRVVVLNTNGSIATEFVQEKGSLKFAQQKRNASGVRLWYDASGTETTVNTGIPVLISATAPTGFAAEQVYLDGSFTEVLVNTGNPQYQTNFLSGSPLYVNSGGYRTTSIITGRPSLIEINVTQLVPFQQVFDTRGSAASTGDVLNIVNTSDSSDITGVLDQIHVAL